MKVTSFSVPSEVDDLFSILKEIFSVAKATRCSCARFPLNLKRKHKCLKKETECKSGGWLYSHGLADSYTCRYSWQIALVLFVLLEMDNNAFTSL